MSKQNGPDIITIYIESGLEHRERRDTGGTTSNEEYQIGGEARTARLRVGTAFANDSSPAELHFLQDHLGSVSTTTQSDGALFSREEYTPYGESAYGSFSEKRNRFSGKEKDKESGLQRHGERYYFASVTRWASTDPAGHIDGPNVYQYSRDNPTNRTDRFGQQSAETNEANSSQELNASDVGAEAQEVEPNSRDEKSDTHKKLDSLAEKYPGNITDSFGLVDGLFYFVNGVVVGDKDHIRSRKKIVVNQLRETINKAAEQFDIPAELIAGIVYVEWGGQGSYRTVRISSPRRNA